MGAALGCLGLANSGLTFAVLEKTNKQTKKTSGEEISKTYLKLRWALHRLQVFKNHLPAEETHHISIGP